VLPQPFIYRRPKTSNRLYNQFVRCVYSSKKENRNDFVFWPFTFRGTRRRHLIKIHYYAIQLLFIRSSLTSSSIECQLPSGVVWTDFEFNVASSCPTDPRVDHFYSHCYHQSVLRTSHVSLVKRGRSRWMFYSALDVFTLLLLFSTERRMNDRQHNSVSCPFSFLHSLCTYDLRSSGKYGARSSHGEMLWRMFCGATNATLARCNTLPERKGRRREIVSARREDFIMSGRTVTKRVRNFNSVRTKIEVRGR